MMPAVLNTEITVITVVVLCPHPSTSQRCVGVLKSGFESAGTVENPGTHVDL